MNFPSRKNISLPFALLLLQPQNFDAKVTPSQKLNVTTQCGIGVIAHESFWQNDLPQALHIKGLRIAQLNVRVVAKLPASYVFVSVEVTQ
ncbi:MAG: hypothetical protein RMK18_04450 [Armatimonadota bacterium]|nr:hypothetical protein [Armatimonadota bacterium]MCX7777431.1 hypothetical protein [Armatimonadota bacterium]MDW8025100.1 hypothetical protein [Armatimonadota bacterium]